ncbi:MAG: hypothetical protein HOQ26_01315 [Gemmatimonadaceae bacterium]|nr:hypothetical protein [Gemmatimonadaceae bacterium]NUQ91527.1 hypothetical protein [Gemmatimonadaceae bacterium]
MGLVASLLIDIQAQTAQFRSEFAKARAETKAFQDGITDMGRELKSTLAEYVSFRFAKEAILSLADATMEAEQATARLEGVVRATGGAAGFTAQQIDRLAHAMQGNTLFDDEDIKNAAAQLLTFKNVQGDVFKETLSLAGDLASTGFGDLSSSAVMLGKALEDPVSGMTSLRKVGITLDAGMQQQIKTLAEHGQLLEAQKLILKAVEGQVGGVAAKLANDPDSLTAAANSATDAWHDFKEAVGSAGPVVQSEITLLHGLAEALRILAMPVTPELEGEVALQAQQERVQKLADDIRKHGSELDVQRLMRVNPNDARAMDQLIQRERDFVTALAAERELNRELDDDRKRRAAEGDPDTAHPKGITTSGPTEEQVKAEAKRIADERTALARSANANIHHLNQTFYKDQMATIDVYTEHQRRAAKAQQDLEEGVAEARQRVLDDQYAMYDALDKAEQEVTARRLAAEADAAEEERKIWRHAVENIADDFASVISNLLTGELTTWKDFFNAILSAWANTMAQMAGTKIATNLFGGFLGSIGQGVTLPSGGPTPFPGLNLAAAGGGGGSTTVNVNVSQTNATPAQIASAVVSALNSRGMAGAVNRRLG